MARKAAGAAAHVGLSLHSSSPSSLSLAVEAVEAGSGRRELRRQGGNKRAVRPDQGGASGRHLADKRGAESEGGGIECEGEARGQRRRTTEEKIGAGDMTRELG